MKRLLIVGAGGALGLEAVRYARACGMQVTGAYRTKRNGVTEAIEKCGATPVQADLEDEAAMGALLRQCDAAIFTPILTVSARAAPVLARGQRTVFLSSNNVAIDPEAAVYARLLAAENDVRAAAPQATIFRPTMIYGYSGDGNLSALMNTMRRAPIIPLFGKSAALQQPLFFADLARLCVDCLVSGDMTGATRAVAGPSPVTKRELYRLAADAAAAAPLIAPVSSTPVAALFGLLERTGLRLPVSSAQLRRANEDKTPHGAHPILMETSLADGLRHLAANNLN